MPLPFLPTRSGVALVTTAIFMVVLISVSTVVIDQSVSHLRQENERAETAKLLVTAESAANVAIDWLQRNTSQLDRSTTPKQVAMTTSLNGKPVSATYTYLGIATYQGTGAVQDVYQVVANADSSLSVAAGGNANTSRSHRCEMLITPCPVTSIRQAMFAINGYDFTGSANTNSWNSNNGTVTYAAAIKGSKGDLASEGTITVNTPGNVKGTVTSNASYPCPPVVYEPPASYHSPDRITSNITLHAAGSPYRFRSIDISGDSAKITVDGKVKIYVDGYCMISSKKSGANPGNPVTYVNPLSSITIIQDNYDPTSQPATSFDLNANSVMGCIDNPQQFQFLTAFTGEMKFNGGAAFGGVLYAPNATLQLNGGADFYGAVIANTFNSKPLVGPTENGKVMGSFNFHYDEALANVPLDLPPRLAVTGWLSRALGVNLD